MSESDADHITFVHAPTESRYEVRGGDQVVGFAQYRRPDESHVDFVHTEVDEAYNGQGLASRLVQFALSDTRDSDLRIIPHCPYVASWLQRHHDFDELIDWPSP